MRSDFLLYGASGFVGRAVARKAVQRGLRPKLAGRSAGKVRSQAEELGLAYSVFGLDDQTALCEALEEVPVLLHCAGPFIHTFRPMVEACLATSTHYLDLTGEVGVYESLASRNLEALKREVMILPGAGFDVVATDCLALHLQNRLQSATRLTIGFHSDGPAGIPPGTAKTAIELAPYGTQIRWGGRIVPAPDRASRMIDFGQGPIKASRLTWGDIFMAYVSTGIPNIEDYAVFPEWLNQLLSVLAELRALFRLSAVRELAKRVVPAGPTAVQIANTRMHVWGEVLDGQGRRMVSRLHGPEGAVEWTADAALTIVTKVLDGEAPAGFQTPSKAYGADLVLECEGVAREDLP